jgi:hypothetical protein
VASLEEIWEGGNGMSIFKGRNVMRGYRGSRYIPGSVSPPSPVDYRSLEKTYDQCYIEARCWFYVSIIAAIVATITTIAIVIIIVNFILLNGLTSTTFTATLASVISSLINGVITYLVFSQKKYANERLDNYAEKINRKMNEEANGEKIRKLIEIVLESHLNKEDQSGLIKEIISRRVLVSLPEKRSSQDAV